MNAIAMPIGTVVALGAWALLMLAAAAATDAPAVAPVAEAAANPQPATPDAVLVGAAPNATDNTELPPQAF